MADHSKMKLGKKPRKVDSRTLQISDYLKKSAVWSPKPRTTTSYELPTPNASVDLLSKVPSFPMYGNDVHGDCAIAAIGHLIQMWSYNAGSPITPTLDEIMRVYNILSPNDDGCVLLDVLNWWRKNAISGIKLTAFAEANPMDLDEMKTCMGIFGGLYTGAQLPILAQTQDIWHVKNGSLHSADGTPGSWGGHCFPYGFYANTFSSPTVGQTIPGMTKLVTWGAVKEGTWLWEEEYVDEVYVLIAPPLFGSGGKTPEGLNLAQLLADMKQVTS